MILKRFAQFLLSRRANAIVLALLFSVIGFFRWIGAVIAGFITIRKGPWEGGIVFLWTLLPIIVLWTMQPQFWLYFTTYVAMQVVFWAMATIMGYRQDYLPCLFLLVATCCLGIIGFVVWVGDVNQWFIQHMNMLINEEKRFLSSAQITELKAYRDQFKAFSQAYPSVSVMVGCGLPTLLISLWITVNLLIARMMDRSLERPEQFTQEFGLIHIPYRFSILALIITALGVYLESEMLMALIPVLAFPLMVGGTSLIHYLIVNTNVPNFLLFVFYLVIVISLIMMVAFPFVALILVFVALIDSVFDCRKRLSSIL